jgi:hypothetical protein
VRPGLTEASTEAPAPHDNGSAGPMSAKPAQRTHPFFLGRLLSGEMPFGDRIDTFDPAVGFLDFGFFGSRLPRFIPFATIPSRAVK